MSAMARPYLAAIWIGVAVQIGGRVLDGLWHANHDEFEAAAQQLEAHWLLWLGVAITLAAAVAAVGRLPREQLNSGFAVLLASSVFYVAVAVWHFVEHANYSDPEIAHVLLALGQVGILAGAAAATVLARRQAAPQT